MHSFSSLIEKEVFSKVDYYFAKMFAEEESPYFYLLAYLLATGRSGHLCLEVGESFISPSPSFVTLDESVQQFLENRIREGFSKFVSSVPLEEAPFCFEGNRIYLEKNYLLEKEFLVEFKRLLNSPLFTSFQDIEVSSFLNERQQEALMKALESPISIISGGPGTGKTFTAVQIIQAFSKQKGKEALIKVAAPTGKAAALLEQNLLAQLGQIPHLVCGTLHSFLKQGSLFADLFLIDEASMLDAKLFVRFLSHLRQGGRLILMGDRQQLPPVEAGGFFADLIDVADQISLPVTLLEKSLRVEKQKLHDLAQMILSGDLQSLLEASEVEASTSLRIKEVEERLWKECEKFFSFEKEFEPETALAKMGRFRILSCVRKGLLGVELLNQYILHRFLEKKEEFLVIPILITSNDSVRDFMNGDMGFLRAKASSFRKGFYTKEDTAFFLDKKQGGVRQIPASILPSFEPAYCLSVHKSQGSEYDSVLILAPPGSERFGREILYTAVTRAKKEVVLLSEEKILKAILEKSSRKISGLQAMVLGN